MPTVAILHRIGFLVAAAVVAVSESIAAQRLPPGVEAISLLGEQLRAPALPAGTRTEFEARLAEAQADLDARPRDADALIWVGRRTAYLGRYREAIAVYTRALAIHPNDPRLYRHRGHRWITVREFGRAISDLNRAARLARNQPDAVEPDGIPNARGIPTSTLWTNITYHLGLVHYLRGEFTQAARYFGECRTHAGNPDMTVAATYWYYLAQRRGGASAADARELLEHIRADMDIIENHSYHRLLLLFKGLLPLDSILPAGGAGSRLEDATLGYGVAVWHLMEGREQQATELFRRVLAGGNWPAFGYLAAEAEVARTINRERGIR